MSRWKTYLPTFRWTRFRLFHETKNGAYQPIWITQIVGGKWWSLSLTRTAPARKVESRHAMTEAGIADVIEGILDDYLGDAEPTTRHREIAEALTESWLKDRRRAVTQGILVTGSKPNCEEAS